MGSNQKDQYGAVGRQDALVFEPEQLTIVTDRTHPLYDERIHLPLVEETVLSMIELGVLEPITVRLHGLKDDGTPNVEVVDGRQRVKHAIEANRRLRELGKPPLRVTAVTKSKADDKTLDSIQNVANKHRTGDTFLVEARKIDKHLSYGYSHKEAAVHFRCSVQHVRDAIDLLKLHPEIQTMVDHGRVGVKLARTVANLPIDEQRAALAKTIHETASVPPAPADGPTTLADTVDQASDSKGRVRIRAMKGKTDIAAFRASLAASSSDLAQAAAAALGWALGDPEALNGTGHSVLRKRLGMSASDTDGGE